MRWSFYLGWVLHLAIGLVATVMYAQPGLVRDLAPGELSSDPQSAFVFDGELVAFAEVGEVYRRPFRSDGTMPGTFRIDSGDEDDPWSVVFAFQVVGDKLFLISETSGGLAVWVTEDLVSTPQRLTSFVAPPGPFHPGPLSLSFSNAAIADERLLFCRNGALWSSDGTVSGTTILTPASAGRVECRGLLVIADQAIFGRLSSDLTQTTALWRTDGTVAGTVPIVAENGGAFTGNLDFPVSVAGGAMLTSRTGPFQQQVAIWRLDEDLIARRIVGPIDARSIQVLDTVDDRALVLLDQTSIWGLDSAGSAARLVGRPAGSIKVIDLVQRLDPSRQSRVRFVRHDDSDDRLWSTDGTVAGTRQIRQTIRAGVVITAQVGDRCLLVEDQRLLALDPEGEETILAHGVEFVDTFNTLDLGDGVVFMVRGVEGRRNLWRSDGTKDGTFRFTDFDRFERRPSVLVISQERLFFRGWRSDTGTELWSIPRFDLITPMLLRGDDRFQVRVRWRKPNGDMGFGTPRRLTFETGAFYFFRESNIELMIKVLDGRQENGHFWVFYGALTNLEYEIRVTDSETGAVKTYTNLAGRFGSVGDTRAFPAAGAAPNPDVVLSEFGASPERLVSMPVVVTGQRSMGASGMGILCAQADDALCLQQSRFRVEVEWERPDGTTGFGAAVSLSPDTGYFTFFRSSNIDLMVKILDGRSVNGHVWVFFGALSNLRYRVTVTDSETGAVKVYENSAGQFSSVGDTQAFGTP